MLETAAWMETVNSISCAVIMAYMWRITLVMPASGMWGRKAIVVVLACALCLQIISPWAGWVPRIVWHGALLHACLAVALLIWRKEASLFISCKFSPPEEPENKGRRLSDITSAQQAFVKGGKKERM